jgi:hypothetical protein
MPDTRLDLVVGGSACAAAVHLLDDGPGLGGQPRPFVQDAELAVLDDDDDHLPAVGVADVQSGPGDHQ